MGKERAGMQEEEAATVRGARKKTMAQSRFASLAVRQRRRWDGEGPQRSAAGPENGELDAAWGCYVPRGRPRIRVNRKSVERRDTVNLRELTCLEQRR